VVLVVAGAEWLSPQFFFRDDQQAQYIPAFDEIARAWRSGEIPLLSRYSWCARGLAGEYQFGFFNPIQQLALMAVSLCSSLAWRSAMLVAFFGWIMAWGALRLGASFGLGLRLSLALAAIFCFNRYTMCMGWKAWIPMAISAAWLPWFWQCCQQRKLPVVRLTLWLVMILTSGWPFTLVATATLGAYYTLGALARKHWQRAGLLVGAAFCALAIGSVALLIMIEYSQAGFRDRNPSMVMQLEFWDGLAYFLPGLCAYSRYIAQPNLFMNIGWIPCLGLLGCLRDFFPTQGGGAKPSKGFDPLWLLALLWFLLGASPSYGGLRFSSRWLVYLNPLMGLFGLRWLQQRLDRKDHHFGLEVWAAVAAGQILGWGLDLWHGCPHQQTLAPALLVLAFSLSWNGWPAQRRNLVLGGVLVGLLVVAPPTRVCEHLYPFDQVLPATVVQPQRSYLSLYAYEETSDAPQDVLLPARIGNLSMANQLQLVNGYSSLFPSQLIRAWTFHTVGSLDINEKSRNNIGQGVLPGGLSDKLGINGILLSPQWQWLAPHLQQCGWTHAGDEGQVQVWHRELATRPGAEALKQVLFCRLGRETADQALVPNGPEVIRDDANPGLRSFAEVSCSPPIVSRNQIQLEVSANPGPNPAMVAVRQPFVDGYRAFLRGQELPVHNLNLQHMAVEIPPGSPAGTLTVQYIPHAFRRGFWLAVLGLLGSVLLAAQKVRPTEGEQEGDPQQRGPGSQPDQAGTVAQVHVEDGHQQSLDAGDQQG